MVAPSPGHFGVEIMSGLKGCCDVLWSVTGEIEASTSTISSKIVSTGQKSNMVDVALLVFQHVHDRLP